MPKNATVTAFPVSELLRENQQGGKITNYPSPLPIRVKLGVRFYFISKLC